mgnify:CR=1 FL=1
MTPNADAELLAKIKQIVLVEWGRGWLGGVHLTHHLMERIDRLIRAHDAQAQAAERNQDPQAVFLDPPTQRPADELDRS